MAKKLSKGRQKVELKKIESMEDRLVTFSKRRSGLYKKANEISTLCGVEIGILVFSPAGKAFTFGVPNLQLLADRLLHNDRNNSCPIAIRNTRVSPSVANGIISRIDDHHGNNIDDVLNTVYNELSLELNRLKKEGEGLSRMKRAIQDFCWWDTVVEDLNKREVEQFTSSMDELKRTADGRLRELKSTQVLAAVPAAANSNHSSTSNNSPYPRVLASLGPCSAIMMMSSTTAGAGSLMSSDEGCSPPTPSSSSNGSSTAGGLLDDDDDDDDDDDAEDDYDMMSE